MLDVQAGQVMYVPIVAIEYLASECHIDGRGIPTIELVEVRASTKRGS
jgi:hypothetical protein